MTTFLIRMEKYIESNIEIKQKLKDEIYDEVLPKLSRINSDTPEDILQSVVGEIHTSISGVAAELHHDTSHDRRILVEWDKFLRGSKSDSS